MSCANANRLSDVAESDIGPVVKAMDQCGRPVADVEAALTALGRTLKELREKREQLAAARGARRTTDEEGTDDTG